MRSEVGVSMVRWAETGIWDSGQPVVCVLSGLPSTLYLSKEMVQFSFFMSSADLLRFPFRLGCPGFKIIGSFESVYMYN